MNLGDECTAIHEIHGEAVLRPYRYPRRWSRSADPTSSVGAADRLGRSAAAPVHPFDSELSYPNTTHPANVHLNLTFS